MSWILAWLRHRWRLPAGVITIALTYTLAGFYLLPHIARSQLDRFASEQLHRQLDIGDIAFNPFTLTARIDGLNLREADGTPIVRFDSLLVDAQISSVWNRAVTLKTVHLDRPTLNVVIDHGGSLNLAQLAPAAKTPAPSPAAAQGLPAIRIDSLSIDGGRVDFTDDSRPQAYKATVNSIRIALTDFRTAPGHGNALQFSATTANNEQLDWSGDFSLQPIASKGQIKLSQLKLKTITAWLQDQMPLDLSAGTLDLGLNYDFKLANPLQLTLDLPSLKLADLAIAPKTAPATAAWIRIPRVTVSNTRVSIAERDISIGGVQIAGTRVAAWRDSRGAINLQQLVSAPTTPQAVDAPAPAWKTKVGTVSLSDAAVDFEDRAVTPAVKFHLAPLKVTVDGVSSDPAAKLGIAADVTINQQAHLHADADLHLQPLAANAKLTLQDFELPPLQPYVSQAANLTLISGRVGSKAVIGYDSHPDHGQPLLQLAGDIEIDNLATQDNGFHQDFVKWQQLKVSGIDFRKDPDSLAVDRIEARKPYGRVIIQPDQTLNVTRIFHPAPSGPGIAAPMPPAPASPAPPAQAESSITAATQSARPMPIHIGAIVISDGSAFFADHSIQPSFATGIQQLNGSIKGLSSDPASRADVSMTGQVDRFSPVSISGQINPLASSTYTDLALSFRNMELTTFNPYSGKFAGYNIAKGKLTTELHYHIENRQLDAQHHLIVDQLEFGPATESKQAVSLPIKLAVALLKDRNGVIDLNLPVSGSLDDPAFRIAPIVWKVLLNTLTKAVTAPFALLGSLFGGGSELQFVDFAPGSFELAPDQSDKLQKLTRSLAERPQLKLDIPLTGTSDADAVPLAQAALDKAINTLNPPKAGASTEAVQKQRVDSLASLYQKQSGKKPAYPAVKGSDAEVRAARLAWLEQALLPAYAPDGNQLLRLGRKRADAVQAALLGGNAITGDRLFLVSTPQDSDASKALPANTVRLELKLQ